jgi:hypothetical protein
MNVKELIDKLQKYDQDLEVVMEHCIDENEQLAQSDQIAWNVLNDKIDPILLRIDTAQSYTDVEDADNCEYGFNEFEDSTDFAIKRKKVLVISSACFKNGEGE